MNEALGFIERHLGSKFSELAGIVAITYLAVLGAVHLIEIWRSFRARRAILEEEKIFHEILKIRYEIEVIRQEHNLADLSPQGRQDGVSPSVAAREAPVLTVAFLRQNLGLPEFPSSSLTRLLAWMSLSVNKPPHGGKRAAWAVKWAALIFLVYTTLYALSASYFAGESSSVMSSIGTIISAFVGFAIIFLLTVSAYNAALAAISVSTGLYRRFLQRHT